MPRRYHASTCHSLEEMMRSSSIGSFLFGLSLFLVLFNLIHSLMKGRRLEQTSGWIIVEWETGNSSNRAQLSRSADLYSWSVRVL